MKQKCDAGKQGAFSHKPGGKGDKPVSGRHEPMGEVFFWVEQFRVCASAIETDHPVTGAKNQYGKGYDCQRAAYKFIKIQFFHPYGLQNITSRPDVYFSNAEAV